MTILLIVIISIVSLFILLFLLFLLPFKLFMDFSFVHNQFNGNMSFFWGSPLFISIIYSTTDERPIVRILGWQPGKRKERAKKEPPAYTEQQSEKTEEKTSLPSKEESKIPEKSGIFEDINVPDQEDLTSEEPVIMIGETAKNEDETQKQKIRKKTPKKEVEKKEEKKENLISKIRNNKIFVFLSNRNWRGKVIKWIVRTVKALLRILLIDKIKIHVCAGLQDPALLGRIYASFTAIVNGLCLQNGRVDLKFKPVFMENIFELNGLISVKSSPAKLTYPVFIAVMNFPYLSTFLLWRKTKKSRKESQTVK
jgi:hypothetical protein